MNCEQVQSQLSAWSDSELKSALADSINEHLSECPACREQAAFLEAQHNELIGALDERRERASRFADSLVDAIHNEGKGLAKSPANNQPSRQIAQLWQLTAALAAGFLIAAMVFQPWRTEPKAIARNPIEPTPVSYGNISVSGATLEVQTQPDRWTPCSLNSEVFPGNQLRTGDDMGAELLGQNSPALRLGKNSAIAIRHDSKVELVSGRLWISSKNNRPAEVISGANNLTMDSGSLIVAQINEGIEVFAFEGNVVVQTGEDSTTISAGESAIISTDGTVSKSMLADPVLDTRWLHPILAQKKDDPELAARVQKLLASLGRSKIEHLQVDEIRSLGHAAASPLIAFLRSSDPENQKPSQRKTAAGLLADLASYDDVAKMISLLGDADQDIVRHIENGLIRITGRKPRPAKARANQPDREGWLKWLESRNDYKA